MQKPPSSHCGVGLRAGKLIYTSETILHNGNHAEKSRTGFLEKSVSMLKEDSTDEVNDTLDHSVGHH
jgi:hypothetical protein